MPRSLHGCSQEEVTCDGLISLPSENLARQSQAVMCDVVDSRTMKGAPSMNRAADVERQAAEQLSQAPPIDGPSDDLSGNHWGLASPSRCHPIHDKCRGSFSIPRSRRAVSTHGVCVDMRLWETGHSGGRSAAFASSWITRVAGQRTECGNPRGGSPGETLCGTSRRPRVMIRSLLSRIETCES